MHLLKDHDNFQKLVEIHGSLTSPFILPPFDPPLLLLRKCNPDLRQVIVTHLVWLYSHWMGVLSSEIQSEAVQDMTESAAKRGMFVLRVVLQRLANEGELWRAIINPWQVQLLRHHERLAPFMSSTRSQREVIDATWGHNWTTTLNLRSQGRHFPVYELARHSQDLGLSLQHIKDELSRIQKDNQPSSLKTLKQLCGELEDMKKQVLAIAGKPDAGRQWERPKMVELSSWRDMPRPRFLNDEPSLGRLPQEPFESSGGRVFGEEALERLEQRLVRFGEERDGDDDEEKYSPSPSPPRRPRMDQHRPPAQPSQPTQASQRSQPSRPSRPIQASQRSQPSQTMQSSRSSQTSQPSQTSQTSQPSQPSRISQPSQPSQPTQSTSSSRPQDPIRPELSQPAVDPPDIKPIINDIPPIRDVIDLCDIPDSPPGSSRRKWESPPPSRSPPPIEVPTKFEGVWDVAVQKRVEKAAGTADTGEVVLIKKEKKSSKTDVDVSRKDPTTPVYNPTTPLFSPAVSVANLPPAESRNGPPTPVFSPAVPVAGLSPADNSPPKPKVKEAATGSRSSSPKLITTPEYNPIVASTSNDAQIEPMQLDCSTSQSPTEVFVSPMEEVEMADSLEKSQGDSQERKRSSGEMSGEEETSKKRLKGSQESETSAAIPIARSSHSASPAAASQKVPLSPVRPQHTSPSRSPVPRATASPPTTLTVLQSPTLSPALSNARSYTITPTPPRRGQGDGQAVETSPDTEMDLPGDPLFYPSPSVPLEVPAEGGMDRKDEDDVTDYSDGESVASDLWDQMLRNDMPIRPSSPSSPLPITQPQPTQDSAEPHQGEVERAINGTNSRTQTAEDREMVDVILRNFETQVAVLPIGWELSLHIVRTRDGEIRSSTQEVETEELPSPPRRLISEDGAARFAVHAESIRNYTRRWTEGREVVCKVARGANGRFRFGTTFERFRDDGAP